MTQPDLARLEGLVANACGLPWRTKPGARHVIEPAIAECFGYSCAEDHAELIVAAVNSLPALLARVRELTEALATTCDALENILVSDIFMPEHSADCEAADHQLSRARSALTLNREPTDAG